MPVSLSSLYAPTAATVATAVAGAVPTISAINSSVSSNASPYGGTWSLLASGNFSGSTTSVTGLSAKRLRIFFHSMISNTNQSLYFRMNSDSSNNYSSYGEQITTNTGSPYSEGSYITSSMHNSFETNSGNPGSAMIEIYDTNATVWKSYMINGTFCQNNSTAWTKNIMGQYRSTSAITSFQFSLGGGSFTGGSYAVFGAN